MSGTNPEVKEIQVGTRNLRKVYIYPLSMQDQFALIDRLAEAIQKVADSNIESNTQAINILQELIKENLDKILEYVCDESERPNMSELTNSQFFGIVDIIFSVNFETTVKNFQNLFQRVKTVASAPKSLAK